MSISTHYHTDFEIHFLMEGAQEYEVSGKNYRLEPGDFLIIFPNVPHTCLYSSGQMLKYSITFQKSIDGLTDCFAGKSTSRILENLDVASREAVSKKDISKVLVENCVLEIIVSLFRLWGVREKTNRPDWGENLVIALAKQYIQDNLELGPRVSEVAEYCCLSTKQLTRLFVHHEGCAPGNYLIQKRTERIASLLMQGDLTPKEISARMHFSNEYYLNAFFKKHAGMPPGQYQKMHGK